MWVLVPCAVLRCVPSEGKVSDLVQHLLEGIAQVMVWHPGFCMIQSFRSRAFPWQISGPQGLSA